MTFIETRLPGVFLIEPDRHEDERGAFERVFDRQQFAQHGLTTSFAEAALSRNPIRGTLRGLHHQRGQAKLVRCLQGVIFDVVVNVVTHDSFGVILLDSLLYIPAGFAHGFLTLEDDTLVSYLLSMPYDRAEAGGFRWDDPALGLDWPLTPTRISAQDQSWPFIST